MLRNGLPVAVRAGRQRALLASLLIDANRVVPTGTLITRLWDDPPDGARNALQNYVLRLRRTLNTPDGTDTGTSGVPLHSRAGGYRLDVPGEALDLHRFDALLARARTAMSAGTPQRASVMLGEALALWRGEPLLDVPSPTLQLEVVPALNERRLGAWELLTDADLRLGRHTDVLPRLQELTAVHPLQERFWAQRMLALYRSGRQGEALDCYSRISTLLLEELGADPGADLWQLHQQILTADSCLHPPAASREPRAEGNLPAETTSFIGRETLLRTTRRLLDTTRLVTLTGPGGVGKTRLALRAALDASPAFPHGAWLADLAPLTEPQLLGRAVAEALGVHDHSQGFGTQVLIEHLRDRRPLLVLDNCEHVAEAAGHLLAVLLRAAPGLHVLATSRQGLRVAGEYLLPVPPLAVPRDRDVPASLVRSEAVRLLADRATACAPGFRITGRNQETVGRLCRRLEGIPLAIELAAVRLGTLSAEEILGRLDDRFRLLSDTGAGAGTRPGARQQHTLRGVVDWSYDLCDERERRLWAAVSVFAGGFGIEEAEAVCPGEGIKGEDIVDVLAALVHKSVLTVDTAGFRARFRMLETLRQYGRDRLREHGQEIPLQQRHCVYYAGLTSEAAAQWCGPLEETWLSRLCLESANLRAALDFCVTGKGDAAVGLQIAADLTRTRYWFFSSSLGEGRHWLTRTLELAPDASAAQRAGGLALIAWIALCQGDQAAAEGLLASAMELGKDSAAAGSLLQMEGAVAFLAHKDPRAIALLARARLHFQKNGHVGDAHMTTMLWAMAAALLGERDAALVAGREYLAETDTHSAGWARSWGLWGMGLAELRHGDPRQAMELFHDALRSQWAIGDRWGPVWGVETMAWAAAATADHQRAARLLGAAQRLRRTTGVDLAGLVAFHDAHAEVEQSVRLALGEQVYAAAFAEGTGTREPMRFVLRKPTPRRTSARVRTDWSPPTQER
ncbi:BTAD domain-containing putative transcriptional regulator [Streptomyces tauricus]|uniref:BTAD domain-containing putative transcriptional regulator n=1 Tax=Streptomyces tauricus TaxID=68274 RepID=UPI003F4C7F3F